MNGIEVANWLRSLPNIVNIRACRVTIGKQTWEGAYYHRVRTWEQGMDGVTRGEHQAGEVFEDRNLYLLGKVPKVKRSKSCFPWEGKDWYVAAFYEGAEKTSMQPFGRNCILAPWEIEKQPESTIDQYEGKPYDRLPMTVEFLEGE